MASAQNDLRLTMRHLLVPVTLVTFTVLLMLGYQTVQIMRDRDALNMTKGQQEKAFQDGQRLQSQLNALLLGTQKLADQGNKSAKVITGKLKDIGIQITSPGSEGSNAQQKAAAPSDVTPAPVPAASEEADPNAPVKP